MKRVFRYSLLYGLLALTIAFLVWFYLKSMPKTMENEIYFISIVLIVLGLFGGKFINVFFHETGHLIFSLFLGFSIQRISILFVHFQKINKKWRFSLGRNQFGGSVSLFNKKGKDIYKRFLISVLGGLIGSLIATLLILGAMLLWTNFYVTSFFCGAMLFSTYILLINAIPQSANGFYNDAALIQGIISNDASCKVNANLMAIQSMLFAGLSPCEIDEAYFFDVPVLPDDDINSTLLKDMQFARCLDAGEFERANGICNRMQHDNLPDIYYFPILTDVIRNLIVNKKDYAEAEKLFPKVKKFLEKEQNICNLHIIALHQIFIEKKQRLGIATAKRAISLADEFALSGIAKMETKFLESLIKDTEEAILQEEKKKIRNVII